MEVEQCISDAEYHEHDMEAEAAIERRAARARHIPVTVEEDWPTVYVHDVLRPGHLTLCPF